MQSTDAVQAVSLYRVPESCSEGRFNSNGSRYISFQDIVNRSRQCAADWNNVQPKYLVTSGQGRMEAVKKALGEETEVELQVFTLPRSIVFRMAAIHNCFVKQARMDENQWLEDVPNLVGCSDCGQVFAGWQNHERRCGKLPADYDGGSWCTNSMPMDSPHRSWRMWQSQSGGIRRGFRFQVLQCSTFMQYVVHKYLKFFSRQLKCCKKPADENVDEYQAHCLALSDKCPSGTEHADSLHSCDFLAGRTRWQEGKKCVGGTVLQGFRNNNETRFQECDQLCREKVPGVAQVCCMYNTQDGTCEAAPLGHGRGQAQYEDSAYGDISPLNSRKMAAVIDTRVPNMLDRHGDEGLRGVRETHLCEGTSVESITSLMGPQPKQ